MENEHSLHFPKRGIVLQTSQFIQVNRIKSVGCYGWRGARHRNINCLDMTYRVNNFVSCDQGALSPLGRHLSQMLVWV